MRSKHKLLKRKKNQNVSHDALLLIVFKIICPVRIMLLLQHYCTFESTHSLLACSITIAAYEVLILMLLTNYTC